MEAKPNSEQDTIHTLNFERDQADDCIKTSERNVRYLFQLFRLFSVSSLFANERPLRFFSFCSDAMLENAANATGMMKRGRHLRADREVRSIICRD